MLILAWLAALAPAILLLVGLLPSANARPGRIVGLAFGAGLFGLAVALVVATAVAIGGPLVTPTLGFAGGGIGFYLDAVSVTMFALVSFVGVAVLRYSRNYLDGDPNHGVFIQRLCLTIGAVQMLVIAGNLALLIAAWVATSLCLNGLLLFYGDRRAAVLGARKKFVVSRLGDACLIGAAFCLYQLFGGLDYATLFAGAAKLQGASDGLLTLAALLIAAAALLKSAQFPLHGWILEVMETPTPVSALLHAGIINAGGFLVLRLADIMTLSAPALSVLAVVGAITALFGSLVMLTQTRSRSAWHIQRSRRWGLCCCNVDSALTPQHSSTSSRTLSTRHMRSCRRAASSTCCGPPGLQFATARLIPHVSLSPLPERLASRSLSVGYLVRRSLQSLVSSFSAPFL